MSQILPADHWTQDATLILTSHSIDNTFDYCERKFEFLSMYDKRPARDSGFAADVGTALHEGTQAWLIARAEGNTEKEATEKAFLALMIHYPWDMEKEQKTKLRSFPMVVNMLYRIIRHPDWDDWELCQVDGYGWAIEVPFLIRHKSIGLIDWPHDPGRRFYLGTQGKIDFLLRNKLRPDIYRTRDLKTTALGPELAEAEWYYSGQQIGYSAVLHAMMGIAPESFSVDYFLTHFDSTEQPTLQVVPFEKPQDLIEDYWLGKLRRLKRMANDIETGYFPRTNGGCHSWGHRCAFWDPCRSRDYDLIRHWFDGINTEPQGGYNWAVEVEL